jgi:cytoskeleton protein RodZ
MPPPFFSIAPSPEVVAPPVTTPTVVQNGISQSGVAVPPSSSPSGGDHTDDSRIVIRARSDSWVQVRDKAGQTLINRVLRPGETYNVPTKQQLVLTTGNAGGVDLLVNGVATAPLGGMGVVRRDIPLDADTLRSGKVSAQRQSQSSGNPISP